MGERNFEIGDLVVRKGTAMGPEWLALCRGSGLDPTLCFSVKGVSKDNKTIQLYGFRTSYSWNAEHFRLASSATPTPAQTSPVGPGTVAATDPVSKPSHYQFFPDIEAIEIIARSMTQEQYMGYCLGNRLKYRLRAGNKDKLEQDIAKSDAYLKLYEQHKGLCIDAE